MSADNKIDVTPEMEKDELVWAVSILLSCQDMPEQINKLSKACLFRIFDHFSVIGSSNNELNYDLRKAQQTIMKLESRNETLERKVKKMEQPRRKRSNNRQMKEAFKNAKNTK